MNEDSIFTAALAKRDPAERSAYLDQSCAGDSALRERVDDLLAAHTEAGSFLETPALAQQGEQATPQSEETRVFTAEADQHGLPLDFLDPPTRPDSLGRLGHYEVLEVIGRGGMGVVLRAFDDRLHRIAAVKVMAPSLAASGSAKQRFIREARAAAAVSHEHVINIHEVQPDGPVPYLVMECISGQSLEDKLKKTGPLPCEEVLRIGYQIAEGLRAAHRHGLIHRDIKPANILLVNGVEKVKITDFGLARVADDASVTQSGVIAGTPQYMSPEQAEGHALDPRSDLFSLGSVLYVMCTGRPPFRASTTMAVLKRVCEENPRSIREINPSIPEAVCAVIAKLHAKKPEERFQSATEVAGELAKLMASGVASAPRESPREVVGEKTTRGADAAPLARKSPSWSLVLPILAGVFVILAATILYIQTDRGQFVIETDDPDIAFQITKAGVTLNDKKNNRQYDLKVAKHDPKTGEYELEVTEPMTGLGFTGKTFTIKRGERVALKALFKPNQIAEIMPTADSEEWTKLYNGVDLTGWEPDKDKPGKWRVVNGILIGEGPGRLISKRKDYDNFKLNITARVKSPGAQHPLQLVVFRGTPRSLFTTILLDGIIEQDEWFSLQTIAFGRQWTAHLRTESKLLVYPAATQEIPLRGSGPIELDLSDKAIVEFSKINLMVLPSSAPPPEPPPESPPAVAPSDAAKLKPTEPGWVQLFNGKDLTGWEGDKNIWKWQDGTLVGTSPSGPDLKNIFLWSNRTYRDFEMKFQVKLEGGNSGVQFRSHTDLMEQLLVVSGPQANIVGKLWGSLFDEGRNNRWIAQPPPNSQDTVKAKEFNDFYIRCVGNHLTTKVNGVTVLDSSFAEIPDTGIIGFQIRKEERTKEAKVTFRDVVIRELPRAEAGPDPQTAPAVKLTPEEQALLDVINQERTREKLPALRPHPKLFQAARRHSDDMARWGQLTHKSEDKDTAERLKDIGYEFKNFAENVAVGQRTVQEALASWLNSPGHKQNLLNPGYQELGLGISRSAKGDLFYAAMFATPAR